MIVSAMLLGSAAAIGALRPPAAARLRTLVAAPADRAARALPRSALCAVAGFAVWVLLGGLPGVLAGAACALGGPRLLAMHDDPDKALAEELTAQLPLALDLLGACLAGGGVLPVALDSVARAAGGPCGARFDRVAAALRVGAPPEEAFGELGSEGAAGAAARALSRASEGGAPVAEMVSRVANQARRARSLSSQKRAKRAGVLAVGPLGACFLPAFVLLGVAPAVLGLAGPMFASFS